MRGEKGNGNGDGCCSENHGSDVLKVVGGDQNNKVAKTDGDIVPVGVCSNICKLICFVFFSLTPLTLERPMSLYQRAK